MLNTSISTGKQRSLHFCNHVVASTRVRLKEVSTGLCFLIASIGMLVAAPAEPNVRARGPHQAEWTRTTSQKLPNGGSRTHSSSYTELSVGLNYLKDGQWTKSQEIIELFKDGAVFRQAQYKVIFDPNAAAPRGAIDVEMPDGKRWRSTVLGIAVIDPATQRSELIAEVKDCVGVLEGPNTVIYPDAFDFDSGARAAIRYTCTRDRFEQDIICLDQIALPRGYGPGSRLEVWSEVFGPQDFAKTTRNLGGISDDRLDFGSMMIGSGLALTLEDPKGSTWSAPVYKSWTTTPEGRTFLIETIEYQSIAPQLKALPAPRGAALKKAGPAKQMAMNAAGKRS
ncbi:MAG TPA: hypothetical protein VFA77_08845, partial [Candidatus Eisenbacteria bacterium]|nr:hypothetical protein [Candidatus Eisenbacteria bacterium]